MEDAPAIECSPGVRAMLRNTELGELSFAHPEDYGRPGPCRSRFISGLAERCNHSNNPNAEVVWHQLDDGLCAHLVALRDIEPLEEVTIYYTDFDEYDSDDWVL